MLNPRRREIDSFPVLGTLVVQCASKTHCKAGNLHRRAFLEDPTILGTGVSTPITTTRDHSQTVAAHVLCTCKHAQIKLAPHAQASQNLFIQMNELH